MLLVFYPVPYVDATASSAFRGKGERMRVGAAGILVELFLAGFAMILWTLAEPGFFRALCYNVMLISGVSTVFFNGNPLLRFDAYYVLADLLEIPNLATRANRYFGYFVKRRLLGLKDYKSPADSREEAAWLGFYAVAAFAYRLFVLLGISLLVATKYLFIGVLLALWSVYLTLLKPTAKALAAPVTDSQLRPHRRRIYLLGGGAAAALFFALAVLPMPSATRAEGVVWVDQQAIVRAGASGFVDAVLAEPGAPVAPGQPLIQLSDPEIDARVAAIAADLEAARRGFQANIMDVVAAASFRERIDYLREELARAERDRANLTVVSGAEGRFALLQADRIEGRYVDRGERLGYLVASHQLHVTSLIRDENIERVRDATRRVEIRFVSDADKVRHAALDRILPTATNALPSQVLTLDGGGPFALDPEAREPLTAFERVFWAELSLADMAGLRVEERAYVLFRHPAEPVVFRAYRAVRRTFLSRFNV